MSAPDTKKLAEKIARMLESDTQSQELASIYAAIEKINHRLDKMEVASAPPIVPAALREHPSLQKFSIAEAIADQIFDGVQKEKACQFEPSRPCDHCSMCNSRGF